MTPDERVPRHARETHPTQTWPDESAERDPVLLGAAQTVDADRRLSPTDPLGPARSAGPILPGARQCGEQWRASAANSSAANSATHER